MPTVAETQTNHNGQPRSRKDGAFVWGNKNLLKAFLPQLSGDQVKVYLVLTMHTGKDRETVWPSQMRIATMAGCSRRHAIRALKRLEKLRLIRRDGRVGRVN